MPTKKQTYEAKKKLQETKDAEARLAEQKKNITENIVFNKDNSVTVNGRTLSRQEYKDLQNLQRGTSSQGSANVKDLFASQKEAINIKELQKQAVLEQTQKALKNKIQEQIIQAEAERQGINLEDLSQISGASVSSEGLVKGATPTTKTSPPISVGEDRKEISPVSISPLGITPNIAGIAQKGGDLLDLASDQNNAFGRFVAPQLQATAQIINSIPGLGKWISGEPSNIAEAKTNLNEAMKNIRADISLMESGTLDADVVQEQVNEAYVAIQNLRDAHKGLGKANTNYWESLGADFEFFISQKEDTLLTAQTRVDQARANQAQTKLRQQVLSNFAQ